VAVPRCLVAQQPGGLSERFIARVFADDPGAVPEEEGAGTRPQPARPWQKALL
jgi:hypothetical protein